MVDDFSRCTQPRKKSLPKDKKDIIIISLQNVCEMVEITPLPDINNRLDCENIVYDMNMKRT